MHYHPHICSDECEYVYKQWRSNFYRLIRPNIMGKYKGICQLCGIGEGLKYEHSYNYHVHHIDGNRMNNLELNLTLLCAECHREVHYNGKI